MGSAVSSIDLKINDLPEEQRKIFQKVLENVRYDRFWFDRNNISHLYGHPDNPLVAELVFNQVINGASRYNMEN